LSLDVLLKALTDESGVGKRLVGQHHHELIPRETENAVISAEQALEGVSKQT